MDQGKDIGAFWQKTSKAGKVYLSGVVNGQRVVMFRNERKQEGERTPDWRMYPETARGTDGAAEVFRALTTAVETTKDDIPF